MTSNIIFCRQNHTKLYYCKGDKTTVSFLHNILLWKRINQKLDLNSRLSELYLQCSDGKMNKENGAAPFWCIKVDPTYDEFLLTCMMHVFYELSTSTACWEQIKKSEFGWGRKVYVQNRSEPSSSILHCYHLTRGSTLTSQEYSPSSVVYVPEPIRAI